MHSAKRRRKPIVQLQWRFKDEEKIIKIGKKFVIAPPWLDTDKIKISLVAGQSFGTGVHETTVSCMEVMESLNLQGKEVLDIGIGSGILSIAAAKLGAKFAVGFDIEKYSIKECIENKKLNETESIECYVSNTTKSINKQFDIVLANIFADIIINMKNDIAQFTKNGGFALFSGVIIEENFTVQRAFQDLGFKLEKNIFLEDYTTLLFKKEA